MREVERGAEEIEIEVENQIDMLSEVLDIPRYKSIKPVMTTEEDINDSMCLADTTPLDRKDLNQSQHLRKRS